NYDINYSNGILDINPVQLNIYANDSSRSYGSVNPDFTATYSGFVLNDNITSLSGSLNFDTIAGTNTLPGEYAVTPYGLISNNYNINYYPGVLTIEGITSNNTNIIEEINNNVQSDINTSLNIDNISIEAEFAATNVINYGNILEADTDSNIILAGFYESINDFSFVNKEYLPTGIQKQIINKYSSNLTTDIANNNDSRASGNTNAFIGASKQTNIQDFNQPSNETEIFISTSDLINNDSDTANFANTNKTQLSGQSTETTIKQSSNYSSGNNEMSWTKMKSILNSDEPVNVYNPSVVSAVFNICKGTNACKNIINDSNTKLMEQSIFLNSSNNEIDADIKSAEYLSEIGYHPAGLKGYLRTVSIIENIKRGNNEKQDITQNNTDNMSKYYNLSDRHPPTNIRMINIQNAIQDEDLKNTDIKKINTNEFQEEVLNTIDITPKVRRVLTIIHQDTKKKDYFDADDI
ncbi:MAG: MBG domain-containing protein, partial [Cyanobacteriota bacterium]